MTAYFIGAGPGAPDLLTLRGRDLITAANVVLYNAVVLDSADITLDELIACMRYAH